DMSLEILLLVIPARPPGKYASDIEVFAANVAHHVGRRHALSRRRIMGASGRVDMVIAGIPAGCCQIDPPFHPETFRVLFACWDLDVSLQNPILGTTGVGHVVPTRWKQNLFAILAINLI